MYGCGCRARWRCCCRVARPGRREVGRLLGLGCQCLLLSACLLAPLLMELRLHASRRLVLRLLLLAAPRAALLLRWLLVVGWSRRRAVLCHVLVWRRPHLLLLVVTAWRLPSPALLLGRHVPSRLPLLVLLRPASPARLLRLGVHRPRLRCRTCSAAQKTIRLRLNWAGLTCRSRLHRAAQHMPPPSWAKAGCLYCLPGRPQGTDAGAGGRRSGEGEGWERS